MLNYNVYYRPPLPRNKYGFVNEAGTIIGGNSIYGGVNNAVGTAMPTVEELAVFVGATADFNGQKGLVPAPQAGNQLHFLQATGDWVDIPAYRYIKRWPFDEGLEERGVGVEGDFHVSDTLSTMNLVVEGQAHFWELVIDKAKANGGQIIISPSLFQIDYVGDFITYDISSFEEIHNNRPDIWKYIEEYSFNKFRARRLWMNNNDGVDRTFAETSIGDMMRCQTFNLDGHADFNGTVMKDVDNTVYWSFIAGQGRGQYEDENGTTKDGLYIDLVFAMTAESGDYRYVPIHTIFSDDEDNPVTIPENYVYPYQYNELKQVTFQTLCGSTSVEDELIEDADTIDFITETDFQIRGVTYIVAAILGETYIDDSIASLYSMLSASELGRAIMFGSDNDQLEDNMTQIMGVETGPYNDLMIYQESYVLEVVDAILDGNDNFNTNESGETEPSYNGNIIPMEDRGMWQFGYGAFEPRKGQHLACLGHMWDKSRQNAVVISSIESIDPELVAPSIAQYTGIDLFGVSITQYRLSVIAKNGNVFTGKFMVRNNGAYIDVDDMINLYITDLETGLETVGIHLDGENSTIRMKGSVELHQHSGDDDDTLSVWDSDEMKRVEIKPSNIPSMNSVDQTSSTMYTGYNNYKYDRLNSDKITIVEHDAYTEWWRIRSPEYYYEQKYPYSMTLTGSVQLGKYKRGDKMDLTNFNLAVELVYAKWWSERDYGLKFYYNDTYGASLTLKLVDANNIVYASHTYSPSIPTGTSNYSFNVLSFLDDFDGFDNTTAKRFYVDYSVTFCVMCGSTNYSTTRYTGAARYWDTEIIYKPQINATVISSGSSFMTIGTNGLVYSVGNGDYFYSGDSGFAINYKNNGFKMSEGFGFKLYRVPQLITGATTIKSELVICEPAASPYNISMPENTIMTGEKITIFGFKGMRVVSDTNRTFRIYQYDVGNYGSFNEILFSDNIAMHNGTGSDSYISINNNKVELVAGDGGYYIISSLNV